MEHTNDPTEVFRLYSEGVEVHEDKTVTISPSVQRDILDCTAGLMHEHKKQATLLALVYSMLIDTVEQQEVEEVLDGLHKTLGLLQAYMENPDSVDVLAVSTPEEAMDIINQIRLLDAKEDGVAN